MFANQKKACNKVISFFLMHNFVCYCPVSYPNSLCQAEMLARHEADVVCMAEMSATVTQLQTDLGTSQQEAANLMVSSKVLVLLHLCVVIFLWSSGSMYCVLFTFWK